MYREEISNLQELLRSYEDRLNELEKGTKVNTRSWTIEENSNGDIVFSHVNGRIVIINSNGINTTI